MFVFELCLTWSIRNLRDFRHKLSQVRESGYAYTILKKGKPFGYFIPSEYEVKITKKGMTQERFGEILDSLKSHRTEFKDEVKDAKNYKETYRKLLEKKYLRND